MKASDQARFEAFVSARSDALCRTAYLLCGDWHQAEDIVQTALIKLYVAWRRIEAQNGIDAYARQIVVRCVIDEHRRGWRGREHSTRDVPDTAATAAPSGFEDRTALIAALDSIPSDQRVVLVLRFWEDISVAEVARLLNVSVGTVKSRTSRGLAHLRLRLPDLVESSDEPDERSDHARHP